MEPLAVVEVLGRRGEVVAREKIHSLPATIGRGFDSDVTIARLGPPRRFNSNAAIGTTANFASKMLRHAKSGDIVLGESARNQLPAEWQSKWTELLPTETCWHYSVSGKAYSLYRYTGRWSRLV